MDSTGKPKPSSSHILKPFHASIAQWRGDGATLREIAERLKNAAGVDVDHNAIGRYCNDERIHPEPKKKLPPSRKDIAPKTAKQPPTAMDIAESIFPEPTTAEPVKSQPPSIPKPASKKAPRAKPANSEREQDVNTFVHKTLGANKSTREQTSEPPQTEPSCPPPRQPWEVAENAVAAEVTPAPKVAPTTPPAMPPKEKWQDINRFLDAEIPKLKALCGNPTEFRESVARIMGWIEDAARTAPPEQQKMYRDTIASLKEWVDANSPEQLNKRSFLQKARDWLVWNARAGQYQRELAASGQTQPTEPNPEPEPANATPPELRSSLFVPLEAVPVWTPDLELVAFNGGADRFTLADACEGVAVFGSTGSGKTSGSGQTLACGYLNAGFGGLVLTAKVDEGQLWQRYAQATGRTEQLCIVQPAGPFRFNFLDYQARLPETQGGSTENVVELLVSILDAYAKTKPKTSVDTFWENTARQLLRNLIRVFRGANAPVTLDQLRTFIAEAPQDEKALVSGNYRPESLFSRLLSQAVRLSQGTGNAVMMDEAVRYWTGDFPRLNPKTRSIVTTHLTSMIDLFFEPQIWELFCGETTITPEAVFDGAVIVVDLPIERYQSIGRIASIIFKHFFQLAVPRRTDAQGPARRPVLLWVDEAQYFMTEHDAVFQATARGSKAATVYLTQNISNCYAQAGGDQNRVDGFFANLNTKIFHANNDPATNHWAAEMVGKAMKYRSTVSTRDEPQTGRFSLSNLINRPSSSSVSTSQQMDYEIQPADFGKLRTGGVHAERPEDDLQVDAYLVKSGARFSNGKNFFKATFLQE